MLKSPLFKKFLKARDSLWVCKEDTLLFRSKERGLLPLVHYIEQCVPQPRGVVVCDRLVGNAAALLLGRIFCSKVYAVVGSNLAAQSLRRLRIDFAFESLVPCILNRSGDDLCPMEKLSIGKTPQRFYDLVKQRT